VADWLYWFDPASDVERSWRWWDGGVVDDDHFWIDVDVMEDPAALGTLEWLLRAAARPRSTSTTEGPRRRRDGRPSQAERPHPCPLPAVRHDFKTAKVEL